MHDKIAIVTGSGGGIGGAIVDRLLRQGYHVFGLDLVDTREHGAFEFIEVDLARPELIDTLFLRSFKLGHHNLLVNAAGIREAVSMSALSLAQWNEVIAVNLTS